MLERAEGTAETLIARSGNRKRGGGGHGRRRRSPDSNFYVNLSVKQKYLTKTAEVESSMNQMTGAPGCLLNPPLQERRETAREQRKSSAHLSNFLGDRNLEREINFRANATNLF